MIQIEAGEDTLLAPVYAYPAVCPTSALTKKTEWLEVDSDTLIETKPNVSVSIHADYSVTISPSADLDLSTTFRIRYTESFEDEGLAFTSDTVVTF